VFAAAPSLTPWPASDSAMSARTWLKVQREKRTWPR